jgi:hypothetical protein
MTERASGPYGSSPALVFGLWRAWRRTGSLPAAPASLQNKGWARHSLRSLRRLDATAAGAAAGPQVRATCFPRQWLILSRLLAPFPG